MVSGVFQNVTATGAACLAAARRLAGPPASC